MKKLTFVIFLAFIIVGCPPVIDNGDTGPTDTTETDSIPVAPIPADTTITDTTDTTVTDIDTTVTDTIIDPSVIKDDRNKYDSEINKEKKRSYFQLFWECPNCSAKKYTDSNFTKDGDYQKFDRRCLNCNAEYKIKRKRDFYECKPK